jgi:hypothetical protein
LQETADRIARSRLQELYRIRVIQGSAVQEALSSLEISPPSLLDNEVAFKAGRALGADYLLVGRIVEMPGSRIVFGKLLNRASEAVESVAQALLPPEQ